MYYSDKLSLSEIVRRTNLARNTINKWLKVADGSEPRYRRQFHASKLAPFEPELIRCLEADSRR